MTVGRLMRSDAKTVPENLALKALRAAYPAGGTSGSMWWTGPVIISARSIPPNCTIPRSTMRWTGRWRAIWRKSPSNSCCPARISAARWPGSTPAGRNLAGAASRQPAEGVGYMTEAYALKRYSAELERMRSAELGQRDLFSIGPLPSSKHPPKSGSEFGLYGQGDASYIRPMRPETNAASKTSSRPSPC